MGNDVREDEEKNNNYYCNVDVVLLPHFFLISTRVRHISSRFTQKGHILSRKKIKRSSK